MSDNLDTDIYCHTCKYWIESSDDEFLGYCRRYPPVLLANDNIYKPRKNMLVAMENFSFPITDSDDWCGEFVYNGGSKEV